MKWIILIIKSVNVSSRNRMFIWRNIKNTGAVSLSHSVYLLHDTEENRLITSNIVKIVHDRNGEVLQFFADAYNEEQEQGLNNLIAEEIDREIKDFSKECLDFIYSVTDKMSKKKYKLPELEEYNDDLHKIDKWRIKLIQKHNLGADEIDILNKEIGKCKAKLTEFEELVLKND